MSWNRKHYKAPSYEQTFFCKFLSKLAGGERNGFEARRSIDYLANRIRQAKAYKCVSLVFVKCKAVARKYFSIRSFVAIANAQEATCESICVRLYRFCNSRPSATASLFTLQRVWIFILCWGRTGGEWKSWERFADELNLRVAQNGTRLKNPGKWNYRFYKL